MRLSDALLHRAAALSAASLHEASGRRGALPAQLKPIAPNLRLCGRALPIKSPPGDNLWLHRAIAAAQPGDVLVVDVGDAPEYGYWGEVMAVAAQARGIAGLLINGGVRDSVRMAEIGFSVVSSVIAIRGTGKDPAGVGQIGAPIRIGEVRIEHGDLVFADADGAFAIASSDAEAAVANAELRDREEGDILRRLRRGDSTIEIYDLPREVA
ncbi:RraA family protein [Sphingomonas sp. MG17]|uniref:Putative 4-hydroxy-4-methyl-2-oxoglutarate aldolase n=1 Tax=Sphingomonas tagetis TaxID=2949092 RepID=A0A9X2HF85_9SPHN|nr:RraA family protein [Sphingomonas tagetis]